ncbi:MAG: peptidyl-prolyl cis-trans isomerase [Candidatus Azobacteroides sp.]|nr:peptidyl-prolyl cis-trans isomerase [Candidatus Azobacteroides sp.]
MKGKIVFVILSLLATFGCKQKSEEVSKGVIVTIGNESLTRQVLEAYIPNGISKQDSLVVAENFIRFWIQETLMYDIATKNVADKDEIKRLVENYRHALIIYRYQEQLVQEKLSKTISEKDIKQYYQDNIESFKLDAPLVKGMLLKIPSDAPKINDVRIWYKSTKPQDLESLDKYIVQNAVSYDNFLDHWVDLESIKDKLPTKELEKNVLQKYIELQDSSFCYFINFQNYLAAGDYEPIEHAEPFIKEILINRKKTDFLRNIEADLYNKALKEGKIKFHIE